MKRFLLLLTGLFTATLLLAQLSPRKRDSIFAIVKNSADPSFKVRELRLLALMVMGDSMKLSDEYGNLSIITAEESRQPALILRAYLDNAERYRNISGSTGNLDKATAFAQKAVTYAETVKNYDGMALAYCMTASIFRGRLNYTQALDYNSKAIGLMPDLAHDSVKITVYESLGNTHTSRNEKLPALKSYLNALEVAERSGNKEYISGCYNTLAEFYKGIGQYSLARDYAFRMLEAYREKKDVPRIIYAQNQVAAIYAAEKQFDLAQAYYEKSYQLADSVKSEGLVLQFHFNMLNLYFSSNQLKKGGEYFESYPQMASYVRNTGMGYQVDMAKGAVLAEIGRYDSADVYLKKAAADIERQAAPINRLAFYFVYADYFKRIGNHQKALEYMLRADTIARSVNNLEFMQRTAKELDTSYARLGRLEQSAVYKAQYYQYKDSLTSLNKEKDLVNLQIADEQKRQERLTKEKQARLDRKHNIQLMGLSIFIFSFMCVLLMLGRFRVSETLIKILSFIALIFLFEFIILIADQKIHHMTHGEPLKVILIKVVIAAILLPLHHVFEHKMIHYLTTRNKLKLDGGGLWSLLKVKKIKQDTPHT